MMPHRPPTRMTANLTKTPNVSPPLPHVQRGLCHGLARPWKVSLAQRKAHCRLRSDLVQASTIIRHLSSVYYLVGDEIAHLGAD